ncbi:Gfo/Idh/MocA family protein [Spirosoma oryzicola]|uniref:Gfo/Idh/MocA family protein n=1 Tax=Spirosoma oryzicola TaxID=2898794 RepID=UPI001E3CDB63|nr:Gfo/Idh/MocA family oxidoreductase [Spirosoma oryzicola]UHG92568.1 Gfo/Idh/MocA family oxidoreductase [Spirosoma oryzicola]
MNEQLGIILKMLKLVRFARIYGWPRALNKAIARTRPHWLRKRISYRCKATISVIGCGQFAFSSVCFFLQKDRRNGFLSAYDVNLQQAHSLGHYYGFREIAVTVDAVLNHPALAVLYILSNHASHAAYAIAGLQRNKIVYVEKPIAVTRCQFIELSVAARQSSGQVFAGYNRPYSEAIQVLKPYVITQKTAGSFSLNYVINGHVIPPDHWYRRPDEGTRICGNIGHWIDLTIHLFAWRSLPDWIAVQIAYANPDEPDDNLVITFTTDQHDLVSMLFTSRAESFEGVREAMHLQYNDLIAHIDDFRQLTVHQGAKRRNWHFTPKDVGHERAVLQPFCADNRAWHEVELSTLLMLFVRDQVLTGQAMSRFDVPAELRRLEADVEHLIASPSTVSF